MIDLPAQIAPFAALGLVALVFVFMALEIRPPEIVAFGGVAAALALGLIGTGEVLDALGNPAPATIAGMMILSAALIRTGALDAVVAGLGRRAGRHPVATLVFFFGAAAVASGFMNNTPVVIVLIPVVIGLARQTGIAASRLLMPLSFMVILGGTLTLIGTSTNLLVDGISRDLGLPPFGLFEIAPVGIAAALTGAAYLALAAPRLLPRRDPASVLLGAREPRAWFAELFIPPESPLIGAAVDAEVLRRGGSRVIDVIRGDASLRRALAGVRLEAGDLVVLKTRDTEIMGFREGAAADLRIGGLEPAQARQSTVVEVLVGPRARILGRTLGDLRWRRRFGVYPLALHREGEEMTARLDETPIAVGDMLLIDGAAEDIARLAAEAGLINLSPSAARAFRRRKAPLAIGTLAAVVVLSALSVAPILPLVLIGAAVVLAARCVDPDEGIGALDGRLLILIVAMIALGAAADRSGAIALIVDAIAPALAGLPPILALAAVYALASVLTETVTNNAVAVILTPVAAGLAQGLGYDPRPFVVAVMFAASASFATPIGYQTNMMVYGPGGYRFADFLRVGLPLNLLVGTVSVLAIPMVWPLLP